LAMNGNGGNNTVPLITDQANILMNPGNPTDWSNPADAAAAQSLLIQQATQGFLNSGNPADWSNSADAAAAQSLLVQQATQGLINSSIPTDWSNSADAAAAQSLLVQQSTQGLGGNFSQATGGGNGATDPNNLVRVDSSTNLRALLNQQISMFNDPGGDLTSTMGDLVAPVAAPMPSVGMVQPQESSTQQGARITSSPTGNPSQGVPFDWNEMLQFMGGGGGVDNSAIQQLIQGSSNATPGTAAAASQTFNLISGLFGPGGTTTNSAQGPFVS